MSGADPRKRSGAWRWTVRVVATLAVLYATLLVTVVTAMLQPPERFGRIMRYLPAPLVWGLTPAPRLWMWARGGSLKQGDVAPDFTLAAHDHSHDVTLSAHRGKQPVVLVFGSYT